MQIKEVCSRTGLTERTVRFYIEKGLLSPGKSWRNGREYLDFSEGDIRALERIAALRRCFFTLEQIGLCALLALLPTVVIQIGKCVGLR